MLRNRSTRGLAWAFLLGALFAFGGCGISPYFPPGDAAHIQFNYEHSPSVTVEKAWFERHKGGPLQLTGYVSATTEGLDTTGTRLEVTLRDLQGTVLQTTPVTFQPRQIPVRVQMRGGISYFRLSLPALPSNTASVTVSARDA